MKKENLFKSVKALTLSAMLAAMSVVIGIFCKSLMNFGDGLFRISFENLPIILSGIILGPIAGGAVGIVSDVLSYLLSAQAYPINLIVTLGAASVGLVSGAVSRFFVKKSGLAQITTSALLAHLVGSLIIKSIGLFSIYGWGILWRLPTYAVIASLEILVIYLLYKNDSFRRLVDELRRRSL